MGKFQYRAEWRWGMAIRFLMIVLSFALVLTAPEIGFAQKAAGTNSEKSGGGPRKQLTTIVFAGVAGAILGLSTLSFYGRPQDKLNNIALGFAIGVIGGAIFTTYKAATQPRDFYKGATLWEDEERDRELRFAQGAPALKTAWSVHF
jgi:hypothetical protein